jgi:transcriptional regulator with XRE-family HTH domain
MNITDIGKTIKSRRKFLGITQQNLAEIIGISLRSLVEIETGKGNPTFIQIEKILKAIGLSIDIKVKPYE